MNPATQIPLRRSSRLAATKAKVSISKVYSHPSTHRLNPDCHLSNGGCCYMKDKRKKSYPLQKKDATYPYIAEYEGYIDQIGSVTILTNCWVAYCPSCQDFWSKNYKDL